MRKVNIIAVVTASLLTLGIILPLGNAWVQPAITALGHRRCERCERRIHCRDSGTRH